MTSYRFPVTSRDAGRRKYRRHGQTDNNNPAGQEDEGVVREPLGSPSGLRVELTATRKRVLSSI